MYIIYTYKYTQYICTKKEREREKLPARLAEAVYRDGRWRDPPAKQVHAPPASLEPIKED